MNLEVAKRQYEVRMLITSDGFMVKVKKHGKPNRFNCFFMDDTFNHRPWILSVKRGLIPALGEYNRLKGSEHLEETTDIPDEQFIKAVELAEALTIDPYCGLALGLRNIYQNANFNPSAPVEESVRAARLLKQEKFNESKKNALLKKEAKESFSGRKRIMGFDGLNRIAI